MPIKKPLKPIILVSGATGFVGAALVSQLALRNHAVRAAVRRESYRAPDGVDVVRVDSLGPDTNWFAAVDGVSLVIHAAARVHVMAEKAIDPLAAFREVNVDGTLNLARQSAELGVKRFVFLSSIKVNGELTPVGHPFTSNDEPNPSDPYGISKCEAEEGLRQIASQTGMEVVIIRPVLVYGIGVKGNFLLMMRWLKKGIPIPLGAINNARSLVALDNLVDLIVTCLHHPAAANQTFLVSDGEDISTTDLLKRMAVAMGIKPRLIPVPTVIIQAGASLLGKHDVALRLCCSLQVDISKTRDLLGWSPSVTVDSALKKLADNLFR